MNEKYLKPVIILYSTTSCHLCDKAREMLSSINPTLEFHEVDITSDGSLMTRYGERVPVLLREDTGEELGWPFQYEQLSEFTRK